MSDLNSGLGNRGSFDSKGWILYAENKEDWACLNLPVMKSNIDRNQILFTPK